MKYVAAFCAVLFGVSGNLAAQPNQAPPTASRASVTTLVEALEDAVPSWGYYIELSDLVYVMFRVQTTDAASPIQINDVTIRFDDNDDPHAYFRVLP